MEKVEGPVLSMEQLDEMMQTGQLIELVNGGKKCVIPESYDVAKECVFLIHVEPRLLFLFHVEKILK